MLWGAALLLYTCYRDATDLLPKEKFMIHLSKQTTHRTAAQPYFTQSLLLYQLDFPYINLLLTTQNSMLSAQLPE